MVERPIKKSERQAKVDADGSSENQDFKPNGDDHRGGRSKGKKDRASGRGKKSADEFKPPVNPALARPPKPAKPPAKKEVEEEVQPEAEAQAVVEESQDSQESTTES